MQDNVMFLLSQAYQASLSTLLATYIVNELIQELIQELFQDLLSFFKSRRVRFMEMRLQGPSFTN